MSWESDLGTHASSVLIGKHAGGVRTQKKESGVAIDYVALFCLKVPHGTTNPEELAARRLH